MLALRVAGKITLPEYLALTALPKSRLANAKPSTRVNAAGLLKRYDSLTVSELRAVVHELISSVIIRPAVRGRNKFDPNRVMIALKLGGIAVP